MNWLVNKLEWFNKNVTTICVVFVFFISVHPFVSNSHGHNYYTMLGLLCTFISTIFVRLHVKDGVKETNFYNILCIVIMALGVTSIFTLSGKNETTPYSDFDLFITTYFGALLGLIGGTFINDIVNSEKRERELKKQQIKNISDSRVKLNWIHVSKKMPHEDKEVLCMNSKGGYFVGYLTCQKENNKIRYQCISGDEAMGDVVCWVDLIEVEKTLPEDLIIK